MEMRIGPGTVLFLVPAKMFYLRRTGAPRSLIKFMATITNISRKNAAKARRIRDESATNLQRIPYVFAPLLQQFRAHTKKNEARLWIPIETNLIFRYEFAALSPQTRYAFVAILLYCAGNGIDEFPLDAKFMSKVLIIDERTLQKSFDELLFCELLQEKKREDKKKEEKKSTDRQENAVAGVSVNDEDLSRNGQESEEEKEADKTANGHKSEFSLDECKRYVEEEIKGGAAINNASALALKLFKTGEADPFIKAKLYPEKFDLETYGEPRRFSDAPCSVCFGAKMANVEGKGYATCPHCRSEKGKATGFEPQ